MGSHYILPPSVPREPRWRIPLMVALYLLVILGGAYVARLLWN
jgi:hypothetical protein